MGSTPFLMLAINNKTVQLQVPLQLPCYNFIQIETIGLKLADARSLTSYVFSNVMGGVCTAQ